MQICCKTCWHSSPQSVPYTAHFRLLVLSAGANPSFIASQMGHKNAQRVYEIYASWIEEMNRELVAMLNSRQAR